MRWSQTLDGGTDEDALGDGRKRTLTDETKETLFSLLLGNR
jgi:hypothetical protein